MKENSPICNRLAAMISEGSCGSFVIRTMEKAMKVLPNTMIATVASHSNDCSMSIDG